MAFASLPLAQAAAVAFASLMLLTLAVLDLRHFWLPDRLTIPFAVSGLCAGAIMPPSPVERVTSAVGGWLILTAIAWGYRRLRGRTGLGAGDPKLFAGIAAWVGAGSTFVMLGASMLGLFVAVAMLARGRLISATTRMPFGTLLAIAALPAIYWTALV